MTKDEQARQRLVEIALRCVSEPTLLTAVANSVRHRAGFKDPYKGSWCAAGLTAAMENAGLLVPEPGTPARRGALALLDWVSNHGALARWHEVPEWAAPGDIIAWKQNPEPALWRGGHAFAKPDSKTAMCGLLATTLTPENRCPDCVWETRKGHVAVIVAVDNESVSTVGWNEGPSSGRVMMRRLWRDPARKCQNCNGAGAQPSMRHHGPPSPRCTVCYGTGRIRPIETVLWRRPGGLYGVARPVAV